MDAVAMEGRPDRVLTGMGVLPLALAPAIAGAIGTILSGGLSIWQTQEQQELVGRQQAALASEQARAQAEAQAAAVTQQVLATQAMQAAQQEGTRGTGTLIMGGLVVGGLVLGGLLAWRDMKGGRRR
jgi:hypothetical protein